MTGGGTGDEPSALAALAAFLRRFHAGNDGAFLEVPTTAGCSSYRLLAEAVPAPVPGRARRVLDLGCGGGRLLEIVAAEARGDVELLGVDLVPEQIARARARLGAGRATLLCEASQDLSLASGSVDCVLAHMSLAVMRPLERTLREIDRVLRPGGVLAVVAEDEPDAGSIDRAYVQLLAQAMTGRAAGQPFDPLGDPRVASPESLGRVISEVTALDGRARVLRFDMLLQVTADDYLAFVEGDYLWPFLSQSAADRLRGAVRGLFAARGGGRLPVPIAMQRMVFAKPAEAPPG